MSAIVKTIKSVVPFGDNLSIVTTSDDDVVIANRKEDGSFRWEEGESAVYVEEDSILPNKIIKDRGYWNEEKNKGYLGGSKGNRVKGRKMGPEDNKIESKGLLFKTIKLDQTVLVDNVAKGLMVSKPYDDNSESVVYHICDISDDVTTFFEIEKFNG